MTPLLRVEAADAEAVIAGSNDAVLASRLGEPGEVVVMTAGLQAKAGATNLIKAHVLQ